MFYYSHKGQLPAVRFQLPRKYNIKNNYLTKVYQMPSSLKAGSWKLEATSSSPVSSPKYRMHAYCWPPSTSNACGGRRRGPKDRVVYAYPCGSYPNGPKVPQSDA